MCLIYDCEIEKAIQGSRETRIPDIQYCEGWKDFRGMGISCIVAYDYPKQIYRIFMKDNMHKFTELVQKKLENGEWIVGFNSYNFDNRLVIENKLIPVDYEKLFMERTYDLLQEIWMAANGNAEYITEFDPSVHSGYGLDAMCKANNIGCKTGHGALAPVDFQRGNYGTLLDYCMNDVFMTKELFDFMLVNLEIKTKNNQYLMIREHEMFQTVL